MLPVVSFARVWNAWPSSASQSTCGWCIGELMVGNRGGKPVAVPVLASSAPPIPSASGGGGGTAGAVAIGRDCAARASDCCCDDGALGSNLRSAMWLNGGLSSTSNRSGKNANSDSRPPKIDLMAR